MNTKTKHTPGPWIVRYQKEIHPSDTKQSQIAIDSLDNDFCDGVPKEEWRANANLIAAAPELLEACEYALKHAPNVSVVNKLSKAIDKAEGNHE